MYAVKFHGFHSWTNIHENKICELGILAVLSRDCDQHLQKISVIFHFWSHLRKYCAEKISHYTVYYSNYGTLTRNVWVYMYIRTS